MNEAGQHNTNDESVRDNTGPVIVFKPEYPKESPWKQPAVYIAILACLVAFWADREARLGEYYAIDLEMKMSQAGMHPPADPWGKVKKP